MSAVSSLRSSLNRTFQEHRIIGPQDLLAITESLYLNTSSTLDSKPAARNFTLDEANYLKDQLSGAIVIDANLWKFFDVAQKILRKKLPETYISTINRFLSGEQLLDRQLAEAIIFLCAELEKLDPSIIASNQLNDTLSKIKILSGQILQTYQTNSDTFFPVFTEHAYERLLALANARVKAGSSKTITFDKARKVAFEPSVQKWFLGETRDMRTASTFRGTSLETKKLEAAQALYKAADSYHAKHPRVRMYHQFPDMPAVVPYYFNGYLRMAEKSIHANLYQLLDPAIVDTMLDAVHQRKNSDVAVSTDNTYVRSDEMPVKLPNGQIFDILEVKIKAKEQYVQILNQVLAIEAKTPEQAAELIQQLNELECQFITFLNNWRKTALDNNYVDRFVEGDQKSISQCFHLKRQALSALISQSELSTLKQTYIQSTRTELAKYRELPAQISDKLDQRIKQLEVLKTEMREVPRPWTDEQIEKYNQNNQEIRAAQQLYTSLEHADEISIQFLRDLAENGFSPAQFSQDKAKKAEEEVRKIIKSVNDGLSYYRLRQKYREPLLDLVRSGVMVKSDPAFRDMQNHEKFAVVDDAWLMAGSYNPSGTGLTSYPDNADMFVLLYLKGNPQGEKLLQLFKHSVKENIEGRFGKNQIGMDFPPEVIVDTVAFQTYFSPHHDFVSGVVVDPATHTKSLNMVDDLEKIRQQLIFANGNTQLEIKIDIAQYVFADYGDNIEKQKEHEKSITLLIQKLLELRDFAKQKGQSFECNILLGSMHANRAWGVKKRLEHEDGFNVMQAEGDHMHLKTSAIGCEWIKKPQNIKVNNIGVVYMGSANATADALGENEEVTFRIEDRDGTRDSYKLHVQYLDALYGFYSPA